jgi:hypothetical protein
VLKVLSSRLLISQLLRVPRILEMRAPWKWESHSRQERSHTTPQPSTSTEAAAATVTVARSRAPRRAAKYLRCAAHHDHRYRPVGVGGGLRRLGMRWVLRSGFGAVCSGVCRLKSGGFPSLALGDGLAGLGVELEDHLVRFRECYAASVREVLGCWWDWEVSAVA